MSDTSFYLAFYVVWLAVPVTAFLVTRRLKFYLRMLTAIALGIAWLCILGDWLATRVPPRAKDHVAETP